MKINHSGKVRSTWADLHVTKDEAERIADRVEARAIAFNGNDTHHTSINYRDEYAVCTTTQRGCIHGDKGYTIKVRGCPAYRNLMMAGIRTEAAEMDLLPEGEN